jgi:FkbM family methyltransferase
MTILDVGANLGIVTQYMQPYAKTLYAIEPAKEHYEALTKNIEFNGWDNVKPFNIALADKDGEAKLRLFNDNRTCHSIDIPTNVGEQFDTVKTETFETFFKENTIEQVDFCKFDVEGEEDKILRSPTFRSVAEKIKAIEVEFHYPSYPELVKIMIEMGYTARRYDSSAIVILFTRS